MRLHAPHFWHDSAPSLMSDLLLPLSKITDYLARRRQKHPSCKLSVPVLCCGNISVGGTGKTPLALHILRKLQLRGRNPHVITRGYGGRSKRSKRIDPTQDHAIDVGDEAMLFAQLAPTWRGADRLTNAQHAIEQGADCLLLDDGLQDPCLHKDISILTIDGPVGFGNQRLLPAGPLRETLATAIPRLNAAVIFGQDVHHVSQQLPPNMPVLHGVLASGKDLRPLKRRQLIAFTGIGRPDKFFITLQDAGLTVLRTLAFPDHHIYSAKDLRQLSQLANVPNTILVTTEKDSVKLPPIFRKIVTNIPIEPRWEDPDMLASLLDQFLAS